MKLIERDTNKDAIMAFLKDPDGDLEALSLKQRELLQYYVDAYGIIRNYKSTQDAVNVLVNISKQRGTVISKSTARRYIADAADTIGDSGKWTKQAILQYGLEIIKDAIAMARDQNDPKTMILGAKELIEKGAADEPEGFDPALLEPHIIEIMLDPQAMQMLKLIANKGNVDLDAIMGNVMNSQAEDAQIVTDDSAGN
jgi:hypothetical protein